MRSLNSGEIERLENTAESSLNDLCNIHIYSGMYNEYGEVIPVYLTISGVACGVEMLGGVTQYKGQIFSTPVDVILRLPVNTEITVLDRVTIVEDGESETFNLVGEPRKGVSAIRVNLKRLEI